MYALRTTNQFSKDYKVCRKRGLNLELINETFELLEKAGELPEEYYPHRLRGDYAGYWECHILPDWLLIWYCNKRNKEIHLIRTGTHKDLFK